MSHQRATDSPGILTRRTFVKTSIGCVALNFIPLAALAAAEPGSNGVPAQPEGDAGWMGPPGSARYRIDGLAKVTGRKIYARDYRARDMAGWPENEQPVMIVRATDVRRAFDSINLDMIPLQHRPARVVYGQSLDGAVTLVNTIYRDLHLDRVESKMRQRAGESGESLAIDVPSDFAWPFIVPRGQSADFYGQPLALLLFNDRASFLAAKRIVQFNRDFVRYGEIMPEKTLAPLSPLTNYVRVQNEFSYAEDHERPHYDARAEQLRLDIKRQIASNREHGAWRVYEAAFSTQAMDPMFMEPESGLGWYDHSAATLNLVVGTQSPDGDVHTLIEMFAKATPEIDIGTVNLYSCYPGGGFGGRDTSVFTLMLGIAAAFANGRPVRLAYDRFEQFQTGLKRHACTGTQTLAFDSRGALQAMVTDMCFDSGGRRNLSPYVAQLAGLCAGGAYEIPQSAIFSEARYSTNVSSGSQRGFGGPQAYFSIETLLDEAATDMGIDPFEMRRRNILKEGAHTVVGGLISQSLQLDAILDGAERDPLWRERAHTRQRWQREKLSYGVGFAMSNQAYGTSGDGVVGAVSIDGSGNVTIASNAVDMGNGSATTLAVVVGPVLGRNAASIDMGNPLLWPALQMKNKPVDWTDPTFTPKGVGSSSACLTGFHQVHAITQAARVLMEVGVMQAARAIWGIGDGPMTTSDLIWRDGSLGTTKAELPWLPMSVIAERLHASNGVTGVLAHCYFQEKWAIGHYAIGDARFSWAADGLALRRGGKADYSPLYRQDVTPTPPEASAYVRTAFAPCGNLLGLTVDRTTGAVVVRESVSFLNAGRVIVPPLVSGQSEGGVAMAIGYTLLEDAQAGADGPGSGRWNLHRYHVAKAADVPFNQRLVTITADDETDGRGIAEAVMCSVPPAIANAIHDAIGVRCRDLPITAAKVREALS